MENFINHEKKQEDVKKRLAGPDIIRTICCIFVVSAHFYLNVDFYKQPMVGVKMFIMCCVRWLCMTTIPMFMMLSGYFKCYKKCEKSHYMSLVPLFISYIVISVLKMILYNRLYGKIYDVKGMIMNLGNYDIAWYMGMYLGLMILAPFLNKMWDSLTEKREKLILLASLIFLVSVYPVFHFGAPSFFTGFYPVLYYFMGMFLRKENISVSRRPVMIALALIIPIIEGALSMLGARGGIFDWTVISTTDGGYGSIFVAADAFLIFVLLKDAEVNNTIIRKITSSVSEVSFEIYLFAGAFDAIIYQYIKDSMPGNATDRFYMIFITVPLSFAAAWISSVVYKTIRKNLLHLLHFLL